MHNKVFLDWVNSLRDFHDHKKDHELDIYLWLTARGFYRNFNSPYLSYKRDIPTKYRKHIYKAGEQLSLFD